ncbi:hypothetical protein [Gemmatimonas sp.]|uniref:hypothetical protein n=1 Tax=Gemmatimonas sp. TaxID=1962908 RepID=UPI00286D841D|nr:hypothetical protein [Gemmatimonas sp.]
MGDEQPTTESRLDVRRINTAQFETAKRRWQTSLVLKGILFLLGVTIALGNTVWFAPWVMVALALISESLQILSDLAKGDAESVLRMLDRCRTFGRPISHAELRDLVIAAPRHTRMVATGTAADEYFTGSAPPGPRRALEGVLESAWYTRHLSLAMARVYAALVGVIVIASLVMLAAAPRYTSAASPDAVVKAVAAWLTLSVSLGMIKNVIAYFRMASRCERTVHSTERLLAVGDVTETEAVRQWYEYQIARAGMPLLPEWLWTRMRSRLGEAWRARAE